MTDDWEVLTIQLIVMFSICCPVVKEDGVTPITIAWTETSTHQIILCVCKSIISTETPDKLQYLYSLTWIKALVYVHTFYMTLVTKKKQHCKLRH